ncbi:xanthine dehydrogenase small subunit [Desulfosarcina ovata subsp. sediminis]|uniref:Xanthine dehydrogenase small subunit n=1 Tax=Desulfosarcina ovata subsp. sediminis TaxID=885957 RepID=A0A5K7ZY91_9BACT|nr:FAD binding domain-containing protein [Desulfosarcina ovata]BBO85060.1 xanthine dehydrogenase small subunit [Desulfosarcina ovata subsp. sediminis]
MIRFILNRDVVSTRVNRGSVLLDFLRRERHLSGTKQGCREGDCGACSVLVGSRVPGGVRYRSVAACLTPVGELHGNHVLTIEGLNMDALSPVQQAIVDAGATQCGFCTPGIVVALTGFLLASPSLTLAEALAALDGNICRCTGYASIRRAVQRLVDGLGPLPAAPERRLEKLVRTASLPAYLIDIGRRLDAIAPEPAPAAADGVPVPVSGGTDLFVQQPDNMRHQPLVFLGRDARLQGIRIDDDHIHIGATTPVEDLKRDYRLVRIFPAWQATMDAIASTPIRNRATLAGNIINASPIGDLTIMMLALNAQLTIRGSCGIRRVSLDAFYKGYKRVDLATGEWITEIAFPYPSPQSRFNFEKVSRRKRLDIASVNTAMHVETAGGRVSHARISAGGVAPVPLLLTGSSAWLTGQPVSCVTLTRLIDLIDSEVSPIDDVRGTAHYKRRLLRRLVIAHFVVCFPDLELEGRLP